MISYLLVAWIFALLTAATVADELEPRTRQAYEAYVERVEKEFRSRVTGPEFLWADQDAEKRRALREGKVVVEAAAEDGILNVPDGLIHHWIGAAFMQGRTLEQVLETVQAYSDYPRMHEPVIRAGLLSEDGNTHRVFTRLEYSAPFGITAVLDTWWSKAYYYLGNDRAYIMSNADTIVQIENAGTTDERSLPEGQGSGYLWSANMYTRFLERDNGTYVEFQALGLSRNIPWLYGWIVGPFARRVGRGSVEQTLLELRQELLARQVAVR